MALQAMVVVAVSPIGGLLAVVGGGLLVWTSLHLWRNAAYSRSAKIGWQLVIAGLVVGPLVRLDDGWAIGFPAGALAYLLLASHGPVRRRLQPARDRPAAVDRAEP